MNNLYYLQKSNQPCLLFPWNSQAPCPWGPGFVRVLLPLPRGYTTRKGHAAHVQIVRTTSLRKRVDNKALPNSRWIHLTR